MPAVKSETGYMKLPNGLIIQWGLASDNGDPKNFPIAFPNKALILVGSAIATLVVLSVSHRLAHE